MLSLVWLAQVSSASQHECSEQSVFGLRVSVQLLLIHCKFGCELLEVAFLGGFLQMVVGDLPPGDRFVELRD